MAALSGGARVVRARWCASRGQQLPQECSAFGSGQHLEPPGAVEQGSETGAAGLRLSFVVGFASLGVEDVAKMATGCSQLRRVDLAGEVNEQRDRLDVVWAHGIGGIDDIGSDRDATRPRNLVELVQCSSNGTQVAIGDGALAHGIGGRGCGLVACQSARRMNMCAGLAGCQPQRVSEPSRRAGGAIEQLAVARRVRSSNGRIEGNLKAVDRPSERGQTLCALG